MKNIPVELKWHPLLEGLPMWADASPEMGALVEDVREHGVLQPLIVCEGEDGYLLLDGRHRHRAAVLAGSPGAGVSRHSTS